MLEAAWWGFVGGAALILGALLGLYVKVGLRVIGLVMAFGAGVLISAVAFELTEEAYRAAGGTSSALGLAAGSLTFFVGDWLVDQRGGHRRKSPEHGGIVGPGLDEGSSSSSKGSAAAAGAGGPARGTSPHTGARPAPAGSGARALTGLGRARRHVASADDRTAAPGHPARRCGPLGHR